MLSSGVLGCVNDVRVRLDLDPDFKPVRQKAQVSSEGRCEHTSSKRQGGPIGARWQADIGKRSTSQSPNWCENKGIRRTHNLSETLEELYLYLMRSTELRYSQSWTSKSHAPSIHMLEESIAHINLTAIYTQDKDSRGTLAFTWAYARSRNHDHGSAH